MDSEAEGPFTCKYCGRDFPSTISLLSHLKNCKVRRLDTGYRVGDYIFTVRWNPVRKLGRGLTHLATRGDAAAFTHVCKFLEDTGVIDDYSIERRDESPKAQASS